ncbi:hypothetical protein K488DRAFT_83320 [Vararia minispora EC-137]|uniref:Uncharacterized protein n=1 Tax=Vararia minispora EC-137 TaxID=1314806 RepID=A0ACB8QTE7_9AGAM|nr:hypothetical protein K488DRAFT_83320 [Vararia minispora EC-137]
MSSFERSKLVFAAIVGVVSGWWIFDPVFRQAAQDPKELRRESQKDISEHRRDADGTPTLPAGHPQHAPGASGSTTASVSPSWK